jgi:hypothetical protein
MAANGSNKESPQAPQSFGQRAKHAGLFLLFGTILVIPRLRRLRRRVWAWTCIRFGVALCGGWMIWRYSRFGMGTATLMEGLILLAVSLLVRATPLVKSTDALAQEIGALVVLNGGTFRPAVDSSPVPRTRIFVGSGQIVVVGPHESRLLEIPMAKVRSLAAAPASNSVNPGTEPWEVEISWQGEKPCTATFHYDGAFAEHLARVAESTLRSQWKKELPVIS